MPRARRDWTTLLAEIRQLLRETTAADSYWSDADLLDYFNQAYDLRCMWLMDQHEGWLTERWKTDLVANQKVYTLPEGVDRIKRVLFRFTGGTTYEVPLTRAERWSDPTYEEAVNTTANGGVPTYRTLGKLLYIEPPSAEARTDGLVIELEALPTRFTGGGDKIDLALPSVLETLLVYDVWDIALGVEDASEIGVSQNARDRLRTFHAQYQKAFFDVTSTRTHGRVFGSRFYLGD